MRLCAPFNTMLLFTANLPWENIEALNFLSIYGRRLTHNLGSPAPLIASTIRRGALVVATLEPGHINCRCDMATLLVALAVTWSRAE